MTVQEKSEALIPDDLRPSSFRRAGIGMHISTRRRRTSRCDVAAQWTPAGTAIRANAEAWERDISHIAKMYTGSDAQATNDKLSRRGTMDAGGDRYSFQHRNMETCKKGTGRRSHALRSVLPNPIEPPLLRADVVGDVVGSPGKRPFLRDIALPGFECLVVQVKRGAGFQQERRPVTVGCESCQSVRRSYRGNPLYAGGSHVPSAGRSLQGGRCAL